MASIYSSFEFPVVVAGVVMFLRSFAGYIPVELRRYVSAKLRSILSIFSNEATLLIHEFDGIEKNRLFYAAELYVATITAAATTTTYRATLPEKESKIQISLGESEEITDKFCGIEVKWRLVKEKIQTRNPDIYRAAMISESSHLQLSFHKNHYKKVVEDYFPYVLESSEAVKEGNKNLKLYTLKNDRIHGLRANNPWQSVNLDHPSKFETLAMDDEIKKMVINDLDLFLKRKKLY